MKAETTQKLCMRQRIVCYRFHFIPSGLMNSIFQRQVRQIDRASERASWRNSEQIETTERATCNWKKLSAELNEPESFCHVS